MLKPLRIKLKAKKASSTTWVDNRARDNWFISGFAGIGGNLTGDAKDAGKPWNAFSSDEAKEGFWNPVYGGAVGKWYSPVYGVRFAAKYGKARAFDEVQTDLYEQTGYAEYINGNVDFMINLKNLFMPYNPKGVFNPVLYGGPGAAYVLKNDDYNLKDFWTFAVNAGLQLNFRLHKHWDIFLDGNVAMYPDKFDRNGEAAFASSDVVTSVALGLTYKFNFTGFVKADFNDPAVIKGLNDKINSLREEADMLRNRPAPKCPECPEPTVVVKEVGYGFLPTPVFFTIGSSKVAVNQEYAIAEAARILKANPDAKIQVTGYADKQTGTSAYNKKLSERRADAVAKLLTSKYGINKDRLIVSGKGSDVQNYDTKEWNRAVIFVVE